MKFIGVAVCASPAGSSYLFVAVDTRGDVYFFDTADPAQIWRPLPQHPGKAAPTPPMGGAAP